MLSAQAIADTQGYQLEEVAQLSHNNLKNTDWNQVVVNPNNKEQYFVINESGQLHLLDETISTKALLNLNKSNRSNLTLTAIALHPNFSLRDQSGFGVLYTAHLEPINKNSSTKRIQERSAELPITHDAVITEWKFNTVSYKEVDESTKREVLRIGLPGNEISIKQMSFNPSIRSWNDNFGLLHVALNGEDKWQKPLYSGVILRINPDKFGLRSYTVPANNPFLKDAKINDAIYILGAQHLKQFIWPDKNTERLLLLHHYENNDSLSMANSGYDFRVPSATKHSIYQSTQAINAIALYKGRRLSTLRNKLLFLQFESSHWQIHSLPLSATTPLNKEQNSPALEWQLPKQQFSATSQISLTTNFLSEVLLLDNSNKLFYRLNQQNRATIVDDATINTESKPNHYGLIVLVVLIVTGVVFYLLKINKVSAKKLVRKQYGNFKLSESKQQLALYHRHQKNSDTVIDLVDIVSSRVLLNEQSICLINAEAGHGFSNEQEQDLRAIFTKEHVEKMVDGKLRQITLQLDDKQKHTYTICLYMRKGSDRITKMSYKEAIDKLVDWCWLIAQQINSDNTGKRKIPKCSTVTENANKEDKKGVSLHHQAAAVRPAMNNSSSREDVSDEKQTENIDMESGSKTGVKAAKNPQHSKTHKETSEVDTELVNALEKLVDLKQQGFLTVEEFSQAKAKLFENLLNKE